MPKKPSRIRVAFKLIFAAIAAVATAAAVLVFMVDIALAFNFWHLGGGTDPLAASVAGGLKWSIDKFVWAIVGGMTFLYHQSIASLSQFGVAQQMAVGITLGGGALFSFIVAFLLLRRTWKREVAYLNDRWYHSRSAKNVKEVCPVCKTLQPLYHVEGGAPADWFFFEHDAGGTRCAGSHQRIKV